MPGKYRRFTDEERAELVRLYTDEYPLARLAELFGCSITPIRRVLAEEEVPQRDRCQLLRAVVREGEKQCSRCRRWLPLADFYPQKGRPCGRVSACKVCMDTAARKDYAKKLPSKLGISVDEYELLLQQQNSACAICAKPETRARRGRTVRLAVDHNHASRRIRGLLCHNCNLGLGLFKDDPTILAKAAAYLRKKTR